MAAGQDFGGYNSSADALYNSENLSKVLQIKYSNSVYGQISDEHKEFEMIKKKKVGDEVGRSLNFMLLTDYGPSAIGATGTGAHAFKDQAQANIDEKAAFMKQKSSTIGLSYSLLKRAAKANTFENPLSIEVDSKASAYKRLMASEFHRDGSGVVGKVASHTTDSPTVVGGSIVITLASGRGGESRGLEFGDILLARKADGTEASAGSSLVVSDKSRSANTVTVTVAGASVAAAALDAAWLFRKSDVDDIISGGNTTADFLAINDAQVTPAGKEFDKLALNCAGLETLYANDGRKIHDITMSGVTAGTVYDVEGTPISLDDLYGALDKVKIIAGRARHKWTQLMASNETLRSIIDGQEQDRRLQANSDKERGFGGFKYVHDDSSLEMLTTEYVRDDRIWSIPEGKGVCEMIGKDFEDVQIGGQKEFMQLSGGVRKAGFEKYLVSYMVYLSRKPNAVVSLRNFTV
jgi:hypothetical protein